MFYFFKACQVKLVKITHKIRENPPWKLLYQFEYPAWNLLKYFSLGDSHLLWYMGTIGIKGDPSDGKIFGSRTRAYNFRAALFYHWYMPRQLYPLADPIKNCKWVSSAADLDRVMKRFIRFAISFEERKKRKPFVWILSFSMHFIGILYKLDGDKYA